MRSCISNISNPSNLICGLATGSENIVSLALSQLARSKAGGIHLSIAMPICIAHPPHHCSGAQGVCS